MRVHLIAIGGSVMHNLALVLKEKGHIVSGSDDEIFDPAATNLKNAGLLPAEFGWFPDKITNEIDICVLGMHARKDNPELYKAQELGVKVVSFPEFLYQESINKQRVVVGGSHGKTTVTSIIIHVLNKTGKNPDYMVGAAIKGYNRPMKLTKEANIMVFEGDEYLSSPLDNTPKFLHYHHHIGIITGIAWDHINVFPTFEEYQKQFELFIKQSPKAGILIYNEDDKIVKKLVKDAHLSSDISQIPYSKVKHKTDKGITYLKCNDEWFESPIFGDHNLLNISAALHACMKLGVSENEFMEAFKSFKGASMRMEKIAEMGATKVFRDFAHAPSKVEATVLAVKKQFPKQKLVACMELRTYSSLNEKFLAQYKHTMKHADVAIVYFNPQNIRLKRLEPFNDIMVREAFADKNLEVFTDAVQLERFILSQSWKDANLLMMSSGDFGGIDLKKLCEEIGKK
jgi:UDP-N-acetylmuramate: L-alanyl-gamma-D-glutamyl-meso-diaminopimelate ligase